MLEKIKAFLSPKVPIQGDIFERARYTLIYRMTLFLSVSLFFLAIILYSLFNIQFAITTFIGFLASVLIFIYIRKTGSYKRFIKAFNILDIILCNGTLYLIKDLPHVVDALWAVVSCLFAFLSLGKKWGTAFTIINGISLGIYYYFFINGEQLKLESMNFTQNIAMTINFTLSFTIIYYLNWQSLKTNQEAQEELKHSKLALEEQFDLINQQNDEKTVLLKEIHHRVKNNLQVIVSLLRLQTRDISEEKELKKFNESINRVLAMSLIHEKIYQTEDFSKIDLQDYFKTLANDMIRSFQVDKRIDIEIVCKVDNLGLKPIVPVALIFNELLSNSIKYAFTEVENPKIVVNMNENIQNFVEFNYSDNGNWREPVRDNSFGLELIETLTEQLNGHYEVYKSKGTKYQFYFDKLNT